MDTKSLLIGIGSFIAGGLLVSIAATTFEKESSEGVVQTRNASMDEAMHMSSESLKGKTGDDFDKAFITEMIMHHEGAIEMAKLSETRASHQEIKDLSQTIIKAQEQEISDMKKWQDEWYSASTSGDRMMMH